MNPPPRPPSSPSFDFPLTLKAARGGDAAAAEVLFERLYPGVERMVHRSLSRDLRSQRPWLNVRFSTGDVVQEVFRSLLCDVRGFEGATEDAFSGYLAMVVRNRLLDAIRFHEAAQRDGRRTMESVDDNDPVSPRRGPSTDAASVEELEAFRAALNTFPEAERLLLRARLEQGATFKELADLLGYPSKSAARRAFYAAQARLVLRIGRGRSE